jgi:hypothetical protein
MSNKFKITSVKKQMVDGVHEVDLSHNQDKTEWFVTVTGEFYTEFTFKVIGAAFDMYKLCTQSTNIFMDSLAVGITKRDTYLPEVDTTKATSPEAIEYEQKSGWYRMSDAEVKNYEEGL